MKQEATQQWRKPPQESWDFQSEEHVKYQPLATDLTAGRLADWLDKARSAGAVADQPIGLEATDSEGNPIAAHDIFIEIDQ
jgi:hypothetical protein